MTELAVRLEILPVGGRRVLATLILIAGVISWSWTAHARVTGLSLKQKIDPRAEGMGGAGTAAADDVFSIYVNPAGLTYLERSQLSAAYGSGLVDDTLGQFIFADAQDPEATWALGLRIYHAGKFEFVDFTGTSRDLPSQSDWIADAAYAWRLAGPARFGLTFKLIHSELLDGLKATTVAADLGLIIDLLSGMRLGAVITNLGLPLAYSRSSNDTLGLPFSGANQPESLPLAGEFGLAYHVFEAVPGLSDHGLLLAVDAVTEIEKDWVLRAGIEYEFFKMLSIRAGYALADGLNGPSLGAGVVYPVFNHLPLYLDYALEFSNALNYRHHVALSLGFEPSAERVHGARVLAINHTYRPAQVKLGFGLGGSYAGPGFNVEVMTQDHIGLFAGVGMPALLIPDYGLGAAFGLHGYFGDPRSGLRPRISGYLTGIFGASPFLGLLSTTAGMEWRFIENLGLGLDAGLAIPLDQVRSPALIADLGLVVHIARDRRPKPPWESTAAESPRETAGFETRPVEIVTPIIENLATTSGAKGLMEHLNFESLAWRTYMDGVQTLTGRIWNHNSQTIYGLEGVLTFSVAGNTTAARAYTLIDPEDQSTGSGPLPGNSQRLIEIPLEKTLESPERITFSVSALDLSPPVVQTIQPDTDDRRLRGEDEERTSETPARERSWLRPKFGVGFGTPYGLLGGNLEMLVGDTVGIYLGVGTLLVIPEAAYQAGVRVYFFRPEDPARLRLGLGYGTAGVFLWQQQDTGRVLHSESTPGLQPSAGFEFNLSRELSLNLDLLYQILVKHHAVFISGGQSYPLHIEDGFKAAVGLTFHPWMKKK